MMYFFTNFKQHKIYCCYLAIYELTKTNYHEKSTHYFGRPCFP